MKNRSPNKQPGHGPEEVRSLILSATALSKQWRLGKLVGSSWCKFSWRIYTTIKKLRIVFLYSIREAVTLTDVEFTTLRTTKILFSNCGPRKKSGQSRRTFLQTF